MSNLNTKLNLEETYAQLMKAVLIHNVRVNNMYMVFWVYFFDFTF